MREREEKKQVVYSLLPLQAVFARRTTVPIFFRNGTVLEITWMVIHPTQGGG